MVEVTRSGGCGSSFVAAEDAGPLGTTHGGGFVFLARKVGRGDKRLHKAGLGVIGAMRNYGCIHGRVWGKRGIVGAAAPLSEAAALAACLSALRGWLTRLLGIWFGVRMCWCC